MFKKIGFLFVCVFLILVLNAQNKEKATKVPQYVFHTVVFGETLNIILNMKLQQLKFKKQIHHW